MTRACLAVLLLIALPLTGCIGDQSIVHQSNQVNVNQGCQNQHQGTTLLAGQSLTLTADPGAPVAITVDGTSTGTGEMTITLDRDGTEIWSDTEGSTTSFSQTEDPFGTSLEDQPVGQYTLTVSLEDGRRDVDVRLTAQWGGGTCE